MVLFIPEGFYEAACHHVTAGSLREAVCTFGVFYDGTDLAGDAEDVITSWGAHVVANLGDRVTFTKFTLRSAEGTVLDRDVSIAATVSQELVAPNTAYLVRKATALAGRKHRGRMYLPGVTEPSIDSVGQLTSSKVTELQGALNSFVSEAGVANFTLAILHNDTTAPTVVTALTIQPRVATQRRRLRG
jgi:hypothetical protein